MVEASTYETGILVVTSYTYDDKGNFLTQDSFVNGAPSSRVEQGDYDDKHAPGVIGNPFHWVIYSPNNHRFLKIASDASLSSDLILKYIYNQAGYPIKVEEYDRESNVLVTTRTYSYKPLK